MPGEGNSVWVRARTGWRDYPWGWVFIFNGSYYLQCGKWMAVPCFSYVFPQSVLYGGLRADIGMKLYGGAKHPYSAQNGLSHVMDHKDSIILRLRYEF